MTFHVFYASIWNGQYSLQYDGEVGWPEIVRSVLEDPPVAKMECPAIILNRFVTVDTGRKDTVYNRYENLDHTTGFFGLDIDGTGKKTTLIKQTLFTTLPELRLVWTSSSGSGVKAIGYSDRLKNLTPVKFRLEYRILSLQLRLRSGMKINFDQAMNRCHQPIFINSDPNALHR